MPESAPSEQPSDPPALAALALALAEGRLPCSPEQPLTDLNKVYPARVNCTLHGIGPGYSWIGKVNWVACHCPTCENVVSEARNAT